MMQPLPQQIQVTISDALAAGSLRLKRAGVENPTLDARLLLMHALSFSREALVANQKNPVTEELLYAYDQLLDRREKHEPISHITGGREFWSITFEVTKDTLDPRADSETIIEAVLEAIPEHEKPLSILDIGTGTGCLLIALLVEYPQSTGLGIDISEKALAVARRNAGRIINSPRIRLEQGEWAQNVKETFDVIISNPPYIPEADIASLATEVKQFEPHLALSGGDDGLNAYRALAPQLSRMLNEGGIAVLEIGKGQEAAVRNIMACEGLMPISEKRDLANIIRTITFKRSRSHSYAS